MPNGETIVGEKGVRFCLCPLQFCVIVRVFPFKGKCLES